jgi:hypothetical protein
MTPDCRSSAPQCTGLPSGRITGNRVLNLRDTTAHRHTEINQHGKHSHASEGNAFAG